MEIQGLTPWFGRYIEKGFIESESKDQKCDVIGYKLELDKDMTTKPLLSPNWRPMIDNVDRWICCRLLRIVADSAQLCPEADIEQSLASENICPCCIYQCQGVNIGSMRDTHLLIWLGKVWGTVGCTLYSIPGIFLHMHPSSMVSEVARWLMNPIIFRSTWAPVTLR